MYTNVRLYFINRTKWSVSINRTLIETCIRPTHRCYFQWPDPDFTWHRTSRGISATAELLVSEYMMHRGTTRRHNLFTLLTDKLTTVTSLTFAVQFRRPIAIGRTHAGDIAQWLVTFDPVSMVTVQVYKVKVVTWRAGHVAMTHVQLWTRDHWQTSSSRALLDAGKTQQNTIIK